MRPWRGASRRQQAHCLGLMLGALVTGSRGTLSTEAPGGRPRRLHSFRGDDGAFGDDALFTEHAALRGSDPSNAGTKKVIFRKEMMNESGATKMILSVDVSAKKFTEMFNDYDGKRCKLCNESYVQWHSHSNVIPHSGREALMLELVRAYCGTPEEIISMWWDRLNTSTAFTRIPSLSHDNSHKRKRRLQYLLQFLKEKDVLRECFNVAQGSQGAGRSWEFERLEWVGDNVIKYVFNNRFNVIFPVHEGGIRGRLGHAQFMIDGNDGLARAYDYLELQRFTLSDRVVSKFKSDVVETLFGELQLYLWSTELDIGTEYLDLPFTPEMVPLRALVAHVMEEVAHVMFMFHVEQALGALQRIVRENQLNYVRVDHTLKGQLDLQNDLANSLYARSKHQGHGKQLSATKTAPSTQAPLHRDGTASLYYAATNYEAFRKVQTLGGLLPRRFAPMELGVNPLFLPHVQRDAKATQKLPQDCLRACVAETLRTGLSPVLPSQRCDSDPPEVPGVHLTTKPTPRHQTQAKRLSVLELKDAQLVKELL